MEKTKAKIYFSLYGEEFPIELVSKKLGLNPTHSHIKGEEIKRKPNPNVTFTHKQYRKETVWELGTEYQETYDLDVQITQIVKKLKYKTDSIIEIVETYNLKCRFMIVIIINEGITPGVLIDKEFIKLANEISAEIEMDLYANPYKSEIE